MRRRADRSVGGHRRLHLEQVQLILLQLGVIAPIVVYLVAHDWATRQLVRFQEWLARYNRAIGIVLGLVIGILFIVEGVSIIR